ncbi:hypothetical protein ACFLUH_00770 [Chloroflexota bacterium]
MRIDTIIMIVVTAAIAAVLTICSWVFDLDTKTPLSVLGILAALSLPYYVYWRLRKTEATKLIIWDCVKELSFLEEDIKGKENKARIKNVVNILGEIER